MKSRWLLLSFSLSLSLATATPAGATGAIAGAPGAQVATVDARVAIAVGGASSTRWSQVTVRGSTSAFVWLVPVRPGAAIDWASDAWLDALDSATAPRVIPPPEASPCSAPRSPETLISSLVATKQKPREVAVLATSDEVLAAAGAWGVDVSSELAERVRIVFGAGYELAAFAFGAASGDVITPTVRVSDDATPAVPLVLTRGAPAATRVTAFVVAQGGVSLGLGNLRINPGQIVWNADGSSSYRAERDHAALGSAGLVWLVETRGHAPLFEPVAVPGGEAIEPVAARYFALASQMGDASGASTCAASSLAIAQSQAIVGTSCASGAVARVAGGSSACIDGPLAGEIDPTPLRCGPRADDLAIALSGQTPAFTWVTRAFGVIAASMFGEDARVAASALPAKSALVQAAGYGATCVDPHDGIVDPDPSARTAPAPAGPPLAPDDSSAPVIIDGSGCGGSTVDTSSGEDTSGESSSSDSCSGSSTDGGGDGSDTSSEGSGDSCGSSTSGSDSGSDSSSGESDPSSSNDSCSSSSPDPEPTSRHRASPRRGKSPVSRVALALFAIVLPFRRKSRSQRS